MKKANGIRRTKPSTNNKSPHFRTQSLLDKKNRLVNKDFWQATFNHKCETLSYHFILAEHNLDRYSDKNSRIARFSKANASCDPVEIINNTKV